MDKVYWIKVKLLKDVNLGYGVRLKGEIIEVHQVDYDRLLKRGSIIGKYKKLN